MLTYLRTVIEKGTSLSAMVWLWMMILSTLALLASVYFSLQFVLLIKLKLESWGYSEFIAGSVGVFLFMLVFLPLIFGGMLFFEKKLR